MEDTEPCVQRLFHGPCRETGLGSQDLKLAQGLVLHKKLCHEKTMALFHTKNQVAKKILIIEDDSVLRKGIVKALELEGFEVLQASDGEEGEKIVRKEKPGLVLLDLVLPKKRGEEILLALHSDDALSHIPVYVLTVVGKMDTIADCLKFGAKGYFIKSDTSLEHIVEVVRREFSPK